MNILKHFFLFIIFIINIVANTPFLHCSSHLPKKIEPESITDIVKVFEDLDIELETMRTGKTHLPRVYFSCLPNDMHQKLHLSKRQELFILSVLPLILKANEEIQQDRKILLSLQQSQHPFTEQDQLKLQQLADKYNLDSTDISEMLFHIDIIPPSLALAQACLETGWGTSYAARVKNSLFGMTIAGVVKRYKSLDESTWAYMRNLNYNSAYGKFRALRAEMRKQKKSLDSLKLSETLSFYCELRNFYLRNLKLILTRYNFSDFDQIKLAKKIIT